MTIFYTLAVTFGLLCAALSAYAIWIRKERARFPGSLYVPIMLVALAYAAATLAFAIIGDDEKHDGERNSADESANLHPPRLV